MGFPISVDFAINSKCVGADILLNSNAREIGEKLRKIPNTNIKYMEEGIITPAVFLIYDNKTMISLPKEKTFFSINNKNTALSFETYFQMMWKNAK